MARLGAGGAYDYWGMASRRCPGVWVDRCLRSDCRTRVSFGSSLCCHVAGIRETRVCAGQEDHPDIETLAATTVRRTGVDRDVRPDPAEAVCWSAPNEIRREPYDSTRVGEHASTVLRRLSVFGKRRAALDCRSHNAGTRLDSLIAREHNLGRTRPTPNGRDRGRIFPADALQRRSRDAPERFYRGVRRW